MMAGICYECGLLIEWDSNQVEIWKEKAEKWDDIGISHAITLREVIEATKKENKRLKEKLEIVNKISKIVRRHN